MVRFSNRTVRIAKVSTSLCECCEDQPIDPNGDGYLCTFCYDMDCLESGAELQGDLEREDGVAGR